MKNLIVHAWQMLTVRSMLNSLVTRTNEKSINEKIYCSWWMFLVDVHGGCSWWMFMVDVHGGCDDVLDQ